MNLTSTEPLTFVNEDTWSVESECPSRTGKDPTEEVRCLECRARTSLADMERVSVMVNVKTVNRGSHMQLRRVDDNVSSSVRC